MDGPRDCHTEWSKSEKKKYHMILLILSILKRNCINELIVKLLLWGNVGGRDN